MNQSVHKEIAEALDAISKMAIDDQLCSAIHMAADMSVDALRRGNKLLFCGNGGSAADAQHWAAELVSRFNYDRPGLPAIALTTDTSILTAIGNDYGYDRVFARQIEAIGLPGDVLFAISTSGRSKNVLEALAAAATKNIRSIGITGLSSDLMFPLCDIVIGVPTNKTARIQECHEIAGHTICMLIEQKMFPRG